MGTGLIRSLTICCGFEERLDEEFMQQSKRPITLLFSAVTGGDYWTHDYLTSKHRKRTGRRTVNGQDAGCSFR
jgi:hypothetical protein